MGFNFELDNDKDTFLLFDDKTAEYQVLTDREPWRDLTGDNLIYSLLMQGYLKLKKKVK